MYKKITKISLITSILVLSGCATNPLSPNNINEKVENKKTEIKKEIIVKKQPTKKVLLKKQPNLKKSEKLVPKFKSIIIASDRKENINKINEDILKLKILPYEYITTNWEIAKGEIDNFNKIERKKLKDLKAKIQEAKNNSYSAESEVAKNINKLEVLYFKMYDLFKAKEKLLYTKKELEHAEKLKWVSLEKYAEKEDISTYKIVVNKLYFNNNTPKHLVQEYSDKLAEYKASIAVKKEIINLIKESLNVNGNEVTRRYDKSMFGVVKDKKEFLFDDYKFDKQQQILVSIYKVKIVSGKEKILEPRKPNNIVTAKNDLGQNNGVIKLNDYKLDFKLQTEPLIELNQYIADAQYDENTFIDFSTTLKMYVKEINKYTERVAKIDTQISYIDSEINNVFSNTKNGMANEFTQLKNSCTVFSDNKKYEFSILSSLNQLTYTQKYPIFDFIRNKNGKSANQLTQELAVNIFEETNKKLKSKKFKKSMLSTNYNWTNTKHTINIIPTIYAVDLYNRTHNTVDNISRYGLGEIFTINHKIDITNLDKFNKPTIEQCFNNNQYFNTRKKPLFKNLTLEKINYLEEIHKSNVNISDTENKYINHIFNNYEKDKNEFIGQCEKGRISGKATNKRYDKAEYDAKIDLINNIYGSIFFSRIDYIDKCVETISENKDLHGYVTTEAKNICKSTYEEFIHEEFKAILLLDISKRRFNSGMKSVTVKPKCNSESYDNIMMGKIRNMDYYLNNYYSIDITKKISEIKNQYRKVEIPSSMNNLSVKDSNSVIKFKDNGYTLISEGTALISKPVNNLKNREMARKVSLINAKANFSKFGNEYLSSENNYKDVVKNEDINKLKDIKTTFKKVSNITASILQAIKVLKTEDNNETITTTILYEYKGE